MHFVVGQENTDAAAFGVEGKVITAEGIRDAGAQL